MLIGFVGTVFANEPTPVGTDVLEYGILDQDGNPTHLLTVGHTYEIKIHFKSELEDAVSFKYLVQIHDRDKHWTETVDEFEQNGILQPNEEKEFSFKWTPTYEGKFRTFVEIYNIDTNTTIGGAREYDFETVLPEKTTYPIKQFKDGILINEIKCKQNLILIQKYDGSPACVNSDSVQKLVQREWGISDNWIKISNANKAIYYELDNSKILDVNAFSEYTNPSLPEASKQTWLQIRLEPTQAGMLKITLPRNLIDAKINNQDDDFFVLLDGVETDYQETKTDSKRMLEIHIPAKTDIIEIVGYGYYNSNLNEFNPESKLEYDPNPIPLEPIVNEDGTISENNNPYTFYDTVGLKQIYLVGEPISFTETVRGYDNPCIFSHYEILDSNTLKPVWSYQEPVHPCPKPHLEQFKKTQTIPNAMVNSPTLNQTGPYMLRSYHSYNDGYSVRVFSVVDDSFVRNTVDPCNVVYDLDENDYRKRTAPPMNIGGYGRDAMPFESFALDTSIGKISIPSYMPSCYEQKSYKIKDDLRTLVYYPTDLPYDDTTSVTKIIQEGIIFLVSDASQTSSEWSEHVSQSVKDAPDIRSSELFRDHDVLLIHGIPSKDMASTLKIVIDDKLIQIISTKLDTTYLMKIFESMFED